MNTRILRPLLTACLLLAAFLPLRAQNWQQFELRLNPGRVGHSFSISGPEGTAAGVLALSLNPNSAIPVSIWTDADQSLTIFDDSVGDHLEWSAANGNDLRLAGWFFPETSPGYPNPTNQQFLLVGTDRSSHGFLLAQGGAFYVAQMGRILNGLPGGTRRELSALGSPAADFWVIDLTTHERSQTNALDLAVTPWVAYAPDLPLVQVTFYLDAAEAGHSFTLFSRAPGGAEQMQSIVAEPLWATPGSWDLGYVSEDGTIHTLDHTNTEISVPPGGGWFRATLGLGMQFWLTRDGDFSSTPPEVVNYAGAPQWALPGAFPPFPLSARNIKTVSFRINAARANDVFSVIHPDTYFAPVQLGDSRWVHSFDAIGNDLGSMEYVSGTAEVDAYQSPKWYLRDETTQENFPPGMTDILDGFQPQFSAPPANYLQFNIYGGRASHVLRLRQFPNGFYQPEANPPRWIDLSSATQWFLELTDGNYQTYQMPVLTVNTPTDLVQPFSPDDMGTGLFSVWDETADEEIASMLDLSTWLPPAVPVQINLSTSRFFHELVVRCANGDEYPLTGHVTQGDISFDASGHAWWNSYGYFSATGQYREGLDYWLLDKSTGETRSLNDNLTGWASSDVPSLSASTSDGGILLNWQPVSVPEGVMAPSGYEIRRQAGGHGQWEFLAYVNELDPFYLDTPVAQGVTYSYRVQGTYGTGRTLPAEISITNISEPTWDTDHDGIPDWWENQYGLDPNDPEDTFWISLGGGLTNGECFAQGLNPAAARAPIGGGGPPNAEKTDTDGDKVPDRQDKYPADKKRSRDLARQNYAEIDISTPLAEIGSKNVLMVALDDNNQVAIGYLESGNASAGVEDTLKVVLWKNGAKVGNTFSYPLTKEIGQDTWYLSPDYLNASGAIAGKAIKGGWYDKCAFVSSGGGSPVFSYGCKSVPVTSGSSPANSRTDSAPDCDVFGFNNAGILWGEQTQNGFRRAWRAKAGNLDFIGTTTFPFEQDPSHPRGKAGKDDPGLDLKPKFVPVFVNASKQAIGWKWEIQGGASVKKFYRDGAGTPKLLTAKNILALNDQGKILGLNTSNATDTDLPPGSLSAFIANVSDGNKEEIYTLLPKVFRKQIAFNETDTTWAEMNSIGDILFSASTLEGPESAPVWNSKTILWDRKARTMSIVSNVGNGRNGLNKDQLMVTTKTKYPINPATGLEDTSQGGQRVAILLVPLDIVPDTNMAGVIGDVVESADPTSKLKHFVTPKKTMELNQPDVLLKAVGIKTDLFRQLFDWEGGSPGSAEDKRKVSRNVADWFEVKIKTKQGGTVTARMKVWVVWTTVTPTPGTANFNPTPTGATYKTQAAGWRFVFAIQPSAIITEPTATERPKLDGSSRKPVLGNGKPNPTEPQHGDADSADFKWDVSRQMSVTIRNPGLIQNLAPTYPAAYLVNQPKAIDSPIPFPSKDIEGNDDPRIQDEDDDPYNISTANGLAHLIGEISSYDAPTNVVLDSWGAANRDFAHKWNFREFSRLEIWDGQRKIGQYWFRISDLKAWHHVLSSTFAVPPSKWNDAGSTSGLGTVAP